MVAVYWYPLRLRGRGYVRLAISWRRSAVPYSELRLLELLGASRGALPVHETPLAAIASTSDIFIWPSVALRSQYRYATACSVCTQAVPIEACHQHTLLVTELCGAQI